MVIILAHCNSSIILTVRRVIDFNRYDIIYKQAVTTEDMFLQMSNKTPSSVSCEDMVVSCRVAKRPH